MERYVSLEIIRDSLSAKQFLLVFFFIASIYIESYGVKINLIKEINNEKGNLSHSISFECFYWMCHIRVRN